MIYKTKPFLDKSELALVKEVLKSGWVTRGEQVTELERLVKEYTGAKYAIATTSATTALHLQLLALGIGEGDEVIVPAFTWVATANVVEMVGAKPVFCDIDLNTYNINTDLIEGLINFNTRAIIPVHLFGLSADMDTVMKLAKKHKLKVIEDAACSLGTFYKGKHTGTIGDTGSFSFHPAKTITTGEGGMIVTNSKKLYDLMFKLHDHGTPKYDVLAYNYRMSDIQGAVGVGQMRKLKTILKLRKEGARKYNDSFSEEVIPFVPEYSNHTYQSYIALVPDRDKISKKLEEREIIAKRGTLNVPMLKYYTNKYGYKKGDFPKSDLADKHTLTLPLYVEMMDTDQLKIIKELNDLLKFNKT
jgi:perosamine synthetase